MIWQRLLERVDASADRAAVVWRGRSITFASLAGMAESLAGEIPGGAAEDAPPDRVLVRQTDPLAILLCVLASWRSGKMPVLLRERASDAKVAELEAILQPVARFTTPLDVEPLDAAASPRSAPLADDPRRETLAISTSGSTGDPKLVVLPAEAVSINATTIASRLGFTPDDRILVNTPLTYMYGLMGGSISGLLAGSTVHLFSPQTPWPIVHGSMRREGIDVVQGPPSLLSLFFEFWNGRPFSSVRLVTTGGEAVRERLVSRFAEAFPQADQRILYGMTEAGPRIADDDLTSGRYLDGCVGRPYPHLRWRIDPEPAFDLPDCAGRLAFSGPSIFLGYLQPDGRFLGLDDDGFFRSPDLVSVDAAGRLRFHGRADRLFKTGGKLVNPAEIEAVLGLHPLVRHAVCRAEPHDLLGTIVVADVLLDGSLPDAKAELRRHCENHLDAHVIPREIRLIDRMTVSISGKADVVGRPPGHAD